MVSRFDNIIVMGKSGAGKQPRIDVLNETFGLKQISTGSIFRTYLDRFNALGYTGSLGAFYDSASETFMAAELIKARLGISDYDDADGIVLGMEAKYYVDQGLFVPDKITTALFETAFKTMEYRGAVLDGFPRTLIQARFLTELADKHAVHLDAILLVDSDDQCIIKRTTGRRICRNCGKVYHIEYNPPPAGGCGGDVNRPCELIQRSDDTVESLKARLEEFRTKTQPAIDYLIEHGIPLYTVPGNLPEFSPEAVKASVFEAMQIR